MEGGEGSDWEDWFGFRSQGIPGCNLQKGMSATQMLHPYLFSLFPNLFFFTLLSSIGGWQEDRLRRMTGAEEGAEEEEQEQEEEEGGDEGNRWDGQWTDERGKRQSAKHVSGDDLGDGEFEEDKEVKEGKGWVYEVLARREEDEEGGSEEGSESDGSESEDDGADGEDGVKRFEDDDGEEEEEEEYGKEGVVGDEEHDQKEDEVSGVRGLVRASLAAVEWEQSEDEGEEEAETEGEVVVRKRSRDVGKEEDKEEENEEGVREEGEVVSDAEGEESQEDVFEPKRRRGGGRLLQAAPPTWKEEKEREGGRRDGGRVTGVVNALLPPLPFVIEATQSLEELKALLEGRSDDDVATAISRIRTCNAPNLAPENKRKMQVRAVLRHLRLAT